MASRSEAPSNPLEPPPRAILFDLDDTLCDYSSARETRLRIAFQLGADASPRTRPGIDLERMIEESIAMHPHGTDHFGELFARYGIEDPKEARVAASWYTQNRFHGLQLFPETIAVLEILGQVVLAGDAIARRPLGIVTNGPTEVQRTKVGLLGVADLVDFIIISDEFGTAKPGPEIFREALRRSGATAEETLFVGDSPEFDIAGARDAGLRAVWVNRRGVAWDHHSPAPVRMIASLRELVPLLGGMNGQN